LERDDLSPARLAALWWRAERAGSVRPRTGSALHPVRATLDQVERT